MTSTLKAIIYNELSTAMIYINNGDKNTAIMCMNRVDSIIDITDKKVEKEYNRIWDIIGTM